MSLAWSLTSYQRTLRYAMPDKPQMSVGGSATTFLWHTFQVASRVLALALFASAHKREVFIALGGHWALMIIWILLQVRTRVKIKASNLSNCFGYLSLQRTNFCGTVDGKRNNCGEFFYNIVVGWVFTFVMINVKATATRVKYTVYYLLMAAENTTMIVLWFLLPESATHWYHFPALIGTFVCFILSLVFMFVYYRNYHPDGKMPNKNQSPKLFWVQKSSSINACSSALFKYYHVFLFTDLSLPLSISTSIGYISQIPVILMSCWRIQR